MCLPRCCICFRSLQEEVDDLLGCELRSVTVNIQWLMQSKTGFAELAEHSAKWWTLRKLRKTGIDSGLLEAS